ncbi:armadillo-type protein [Infundibulicybe gibba]|nr:armadillo-type protein [Infundibulicybe gibba]
MQSSPSPIDENRDLKAEKNQEPSALLPKFLSNSPEDRSKAYIQLTAFCQQIRDSSSDDETSTRILATTFGPLTLSRLAETEENNFLVGVTFLTALFHVNGPSASLIFQQDGILDCVMDGVDILTSKQLRQEVARLLAQAAGYKPCRGIITSQHVGWLESMLRVRWGCVQASAALALVKISQGHSSDGRGAEQLEPLLSPQTTDLSLAQILIGVLVDKREPLALGDAIEGLAYLSANPRIKESISKDPIFLRHLFSLASTRMDIPAGDHRIITSSYLYGILAIICNVCAFRPQLTEEQKQVGRLRQMAQPANTADATDNSMLDDDENVRVRIRRLLAAGVLDVFAAAVPGTESTGVRINVGKTMLSIVEEKANRGQVLQGGGAKVLSLIIRQALPAPSPIKNTPLDPAYLEPIQALAKLTITASPVQVFGPNDGAMFDTIRPFSLMLQHTSSTLLQRFESMMALTNLASHSPETATRIGKAEGLLTKVELFLLDDHTLVRRAAMELICNLIGGSDDVFGRYGDSTTLDGRTKSRLQVVLALSDVEDVPTRLAASGALALLTSSRNVCQALLSLQPERLQILRRLAQIVDPSTTHGDGGHEQDRGFVHRGVVCACNFLMGISDGPNAAGLKKEAEDAGLTAALTLIIKKYYGPTPDNDILRPALEAMKLLT